MTPHGLDTDRPFVDGACSLRIQTVLFGTKQSEIERSLASIDRAAEIGLALGCFSSVEVAYGDSSADPVMGSAEIEKYRLLFPNLTNISYVQFGANLGSAGGQNHLLDAAETDLVFFINPDIRFSPIAFVELVRPFHIPGVGVTEARQLPIEHPKAYNTRTGETAWAAGACMMVPVRVAKAMGGFDAASFFLHCDDVDLSWRIRIAGLKIIYQPSAAAFHDKRLTRDGLLSPGPIELYYSAEAALILAHKYDRKDIVRRLLDRFEKSDLSYLKRAVAAYRSREAEGRLPPMIDARGVAEFIGDNFTHHRFAL
ncbi:MAG: putative glycosyl transferase [Rhodospirillales bacterium]|nr:putative glycosyl transferase [Rhodospirillales bacterium]